MKKRSILPMLVELILISQVGESIPFFTAIAKNNAGLLSAQTWSDGIQVVEPDRPKVVKIEDGGEFTIDNKALKLYLGCWMMRVFHLLIMNMHYWITRKLL